MARRLFQTTIDYVVMAVSPALIITLIGSLIFFLIEVFYQGEFTARIAWVMACFVFGAVFVERIAIEEGFERAAPFGIVLALAVGVAANRFVEFHGSWTDHFSWIINWGLIAIIWWCAHKLTWDCTVIDDSHDSSGEGLLRIAGLEQEASDEPHAREPEGTTARSTGAGWWQRYVDGQRKPHAPGVWVVYFSLAALPLFGVGQWFIPVHDIAGRRYAFWLLCVYVASGLGLLLTTSFLGLRRYLRQRRIEMPPLMANLWLGIGATLIALILVFAALLPRPSAEYEISQLPVSLGSPKQNATPLAPIPKEGVEDEEAQTARQFKAEPSQDESTSRNNATGQGSQAGDTKEKNGRAKADSQEKRSDSAESKDQSPPPGEPQSPPKPTEDQRKERQPEPHERNNPVPGPADAQQQKQSSQQQSEPPATPRQDAQDQTAPQRPLDAPKTQPPSPDIDPGLSAWPLAELLKWVFYAVVAAAVLLIMWQSRREILAALRDFWAGLRELWNTMWGLKRARPSLSEKEAIELEIPPAPFASYANPFATGADQRYGSEELVRYSFEAFEAWAREHACPRSRDQTPHELAREVSRHHGQIATAARNLAELYARAAYDQGELPPNTRDQLHDLWRQMSATAISPW